MPLGSKKSGIIDGIPIENEKPSDQINPIQDAQHTTVENVLRLLIKDKYTPSYDINGLKQGVIVKVINDPKLFEYSQKSEIETNKDSKDIKKRFKVFILGKAGTIFPIPNSFSDLSIDILNDYSVAPSFDGNLEVGTIVYVDINTRTIHNTNEKSVAKSASQTATKASVSNPSAAFNNPTANPTTVGSTARPAENPSSTTPAGPPISVDNIPQDITEDTAFALGKEIGKIQLKKIVSYTSQTMRADAADAFNQMCKAAKADNPSITLIASSGFRQQQKQIQLYNERYVNSYPTRPENNSLSSLGQRNGVAAYPGTSNHQSGIAVDIDVGTSLNEPNRYVGNMGRDPRFLWLQANAARFGFSNSEGRNVNEPWHWVYIK